MFTYVKLFNYRSLDNVTFDLKQTKTKIKNIAAVYGENGCGKSNLISAFYFLTKIVDTFEIEKRELKYKENSFLMNLFDDLETLSDLYKNARSIDCEENTILEFGFLINNHEGSYTIEFNDRIVKEKLYYFTGKQSGNIFEISKSEKDDSKIDIKISNSIVISENLKEEIKDLVYKFWGRHSMLAILQTVLNRFNNQYLIDNASIYIFDFNKLISNISVSVKKGSEIVVKKSDKKMNLLSRLERGTTLIQNEYIIKNTEKVLNDFFVQTYSDINSVFYDVEEKDNELKYHLMFAKNINGKIRNIPVEKESTGTRQIINVLKSLFEVFCGGIVIIDEIDNGVHDLLLKAIIGSLADNITGQLIFTTHNTTLLDTLNQKMVYLINVDYEGRKDIVCLSEYSLKDHNNARTRYMKGLYGGVPFVDSVDYNSIVDNLVTDSEDSNK